MKRGEKIRRYKLISRSFFLGRGRPLLLWPTQPGSRMNSVVVFAKQLFWHGPGLHSTPTYPPPLYLISALCQGCLEAFYPLWRAQAGSSVHGAPPVSPNPAPASGHAGQKQGRCYSISICKHREPPRRANLSCRKTERPRSRRPPGSA